MRNSINYNLKYFIMKTSGTKPMKNTMRKSPMKQTVAKGKTAKSAPMQMKKSGMGKKC